MAIPATKKDRCILVTGFMPFGGERTNPSWEIVKALPKNIAGHRVETLRVPTEFGKAIEISSPTAVRNVIKAIDMANTGMYRDEKGRKVINTDGYDAIAKGLGFTPSSVDNVQDASRIQQQLIALNKLRTSEISALMADGRFEKDQSKIDKAKQQLSTWNSDNKDSPIVINGQSVSKRVQEMNKTKAQRITAAAPKSIRASVKKELAGDS